MHPKASAVRTFLCAAVALCGFLSAARADVALPDTFSNHMVLQRGKPAPVYGTADPAEAVTVSFAGQTLSTTADSRGLWRVELAPMTADATGQSMTVSGSNTVTIADVLVGDVWICSGQSNMDMRLSGCDRPEDIASASFPGIRQFAAPLVSAGEPQYEVDGSWSVCSPATAGNFTAVGFYFARAVYQDQGAAVPIGILLTSVGGTTIDLWLPPEGAAQEPALAPLFSQSILPTGPFSLYNGMVHPLAPYAATGVLWYQGENAERTVQSANSYFLKIKALQRGWQSVWEDDDLAFYIVMIANWGDVPASPTPVLQSGGWSADTRLQQAMALQLPHAGVASALDIGDSSTGDLIWDGWHPKDKLDVGERLALWALKNEYGRSSIVPSGPVLRDAVVSGDTVVCSFDYAGSGLMVGAKEWYQPTEEVVGGTLDLFVVKGADGVWHWADAVVAGDAVEVSSPGVATPAGVSYGCWQNPENVNLYNREGLPAAPFHVPDLTKRWTIDASAGAGGSISPAGATTLLERMPKLYTITPDPGWHVEDVLVDGASVGAVEHYTFNPVYADHTISATFTATQPEHTIAATAAPGGSLAPYGDVAVAQGASQAFEVVTGAAGKIQSVTVDGKPLGARRRVAFTNVCKDHTITADFSCIVRAAAGYGGTISPNGELDVPYGSEQTFSIAPIPGYSVYAVLVDGVDVGPVSGYVFPSVTEDHRIEVVFRSDSGAAGTIPGRTDLFMAALSDELPASGAVSGWSLFAPSGQSLTPIGSPTVETIAGRKWSKNVHLDSDGYRFGDERTTPIPCDGATIVAAVKPTRSDDGGNWRSIVDLFYNDLVLGMTNDEGKVCVWRKGQLDFSNETIDDGQTTILSLVVQPDGSYKVYANGAPIMTGAAGSAVTELTPGAEAFKRYVNVGRNNPDGWTTFNGFIGDTFLYTKALSPTERGELESFIAYRLIGCVVEVSAGPGGSVSPEGAVLSPYGSDRTFTITPDGPGWEIADVEVDGVSVGPVESYTFTDLTEDHTLRAAFTWISSEPPKATAKSWMLW